MRSIARRVEERLREQPLLAGAARSPGSGRRVVDRAAWRPRRHAAGNEAMRAASASTKGHSSSSGSARFTQPHALGERGVDVVAAEDDLERPGAARRGAAGAACRCRRG